MAINDLVIPFPDFKLNEMIDPEQFDLNNVATVAKVNEIKTLLNAITDSITDGGSGADKISLTAIAPFASTKLQAYLEEVITKLQSTTATSGGSRFIGSEAITGVTGANVLAQLASLKTLIDAGVTAHNAHKSAAVLDHPDLSVTTAKLAEKGVTTAKLADGAVTDTQLGLGSVSGGKIADNAITGGKISPAQINTAHIINGAVTEAKILDGAVTGSKILDGAIATAKIVNGAVTSDKILDNAVTGPKIVSNSITSDKIADAQIITAKIGNLSVTSAKLVDVSVVESKIADGAVSGAKLATNSISTVKVQDGAITAAKLDPALAGVNYVDVAAHDGNPNAHNTKTWKPFVLNNGIGVYTADRDGPLNILSIKGRTLVNLLGRDGNFEVDSNADGIADGWTFPNAGLASLDTTNVKYGTKSQKIAAILADASNARYIQKNNASVESGKYYIFLVDAVTDGSGIAGVNVSGNTATISNVSTVASTVSKTHYAKCNPTVSGTIYLRLYNTVVVGSTASVWYDGARLHEISASDYAKIDVDPEWTGSKLADKFPYVDDMKHVNGVHVTNRGENLFPPFNDSLWKNLFTTGTIETLDSYALKFNKTAGGQSTYQITLPVVGGQSYSLNVSADVSNIGGVVTFGSYVNITAYDEKNTNLGVYWASPYGSANGVFDMKSTFTLPASATSVTIVIDTEASTSGTFVFTKLMLNPGATLRPFKPQQPSYMYLPDVQLRSNVDGSVADILSTAGDGEPRITRRFREMLLDGSLAWTFGADYSGFKHVVVPISGSLYNNEIVTKYDGKNATVMSEGASFTGADQVNLSSDLNLYLSIADADSGWGETYSPTVDEIKAYFMGWWMYNTVDSANYNGTGTKAWKKRTNGTSGQTTLPTESYVGYTPYRLMYQLALSITDTSKHEGKVMVHAGSNQIEVGTGIVVREGIIPSTNTSYSSSYINHPTFPETLASKRVKNILSVYINNVKDYRWTLPNNTALMPLIHLDKSSAYSITYLGLDPHTIGIVPLSISGEYPITSLATDIELARGLFEAKTELDVLRNTKAQKQQPQWITPTLLNGWVSYNTSSLLIGYYKDDMGFVRIRGIAKSGTMAAGTVLFTLPVGYRPEIHCNFATLCSNDAGTFGSVQLSVDYSTGQVKLQNTIGYNGALLLDVPPFTTRQ